MADARRHARFPAKSWRGQAATQSRPGAAAGRPTSSRRLQIAAACTAGAAEAPEGAAARHLRAGGMDMLRGGHTAGALGCRCAAGRCSGPPARAWRRALSGSRAAMPRARGGLCRRPATVSALRLADVTSRVDASGRKSVLFVDGEPPSTTARRPLTASARDLRRTTMAITIATGWGQRASRWRPAKDSPFRAGSRCLRTGEDRIGHFRRT